MGAYINPPNGVSKEAWLEEFAIEVPRPKNWSEVDGALPVCLVDNGPFTAAAVCFSDREFEDFADPRDHRQKRWFMAGVIDLYKVSNLEQYREPQATDHDIFSLQGAL